MNVEHLTIANQKDTFAEMNKRKPADVFKKHVVLPLHSAHMQIASTHGMCKANSL